MGSVVSWFYTRPSNSSTTQPSESNASESSNNELPPATTNNSSVVSLAQPTRNDTSESTIRSSDPSVSTSLSLQTVHSPSPMGGASSPTLPPLSPSHAIPAAQHRHSPPIGNDDPAAPLPTPPPNQGLKIAIPPADEPLPEIAAYNADADVSVDLCLDDEGLSALEKIYLFSRSSASFHRVFIARSLPSFLPDISPSDAVEYVIPLMNGLAMDEEELVKEALVEELPSTIWWFSSNCQLVEDEPPEVANNHDPPLLSVQAFTPLLGTLLLSPNSLVCAPARYSVVNLLGRIREADKNEAANSHLGYKERRMLEQELLQQVVIGMGRLESPSAQCEETRELTLTSDSVSQTEHPARGPASPRSPRPTGIPLDSAAHMAIEVETSLPRPSPTLSPLSPDSSERLSTGFHSTPLSSPHISSNLRSPSPMPSIYMQPNPQMPELGSDHRYVDYSEADVTAPWSSSTSPSSYDVPTGTVQEPHQDLTAQERNTFQRAESDDSFVSFNDHDGSDQGAVGRLASMSLIAAVTADGPLTHEIQEAFVGEVVRVGHDPLYWVRREATFALGALAKIVPEEIVLSMLLPLFQDLCLDPVWHVRQSVLFSLPAILSRLPAVKRRSQALKTVLSLSVDPSTTVRSGVLEVLGEVIYAFYGDAKGPPDEILRLFIGEEGKDWGVQKQQEQRFNGIQGPWNASTSEHRREGPMQFYSTPSGVMSTHGFVPDPARPLICAFNMPAVALTLGRHRWHELRGLYLSLAQQQNVKVRETLAASIGEIAKIIGPENARRDLLGIWQDFVRTEDGAVRSKVLEYLVVFLQGLDPSDRQQIVQSLDDMWTVHIRSWREREVLAAALGSFAPLMVGSGHVLRALLQKSLDDETMAVRQAAISVYPQIRKSLADRPDVLRGLREEVDCLAYADSFRKRVTYIACQQALVLSDKQPDAITDSDFWRAVTVLSSDRIDDVRIGAARLLNSAYAKCVHGSHSIPEDIPDVIRRLSRDVSQDVRSFVTGDLSLASSSVMDVTEPETPSMCNIFSRPPPTTSASPSLVDGMHQLKVEDHRPMELDGPFTQGTERSMPGFHRGERTTRSSDMGTSEVKHGIMYG